MSNFLPNHLLTPEEALAQGALAAGIEMATSYPGSPGIGVMNALIEQAKKDNSLYIEWSANERVALEMCIGASMAGKRSLVCIKSVGMNVLLDPLMTLNLTGTHGGLVILLGDDPGAYGSQNEQDSRLLAPFIEIPFLEPATSAEAFRMMREAFEVSERFKSPIVIRITRSFTQQPPMQVPDELELNEKNQTLGMVRESYRFVPYPGNAVDLHRKQHHRLDEFEHWLNRAPWDEIHGSGAKGVVATGFCHQKLLDTASIAEGSPLFPENLRLLKLSSLYPLPKKTIQRFLNGCKEVLVLEESDAFIEASLKELAYDLGAYPKIYGKQSGHLPYGDELLRWQIRAALENFIPGIKLQQTYTEAEQTQERPIKKNHCASSPNDHIIALLQETADESGQKPILVSDPGCWVKVAGELNGKFAIGSAVAVASGLYKLGVTEPVVALFGDSAFFHSAVSAICNAASNGAKVFILILDNGGALSTGSQPTPATGLDAIGRETKSLRITEIAQACGVESIKRLPANTNDDTIKFYLRLGLEEPQLSMLILEIES
jgi:indolepyruvate ferredoxin oxidoreductase alpha subunit